MRQFPMFDAEPLKEFMRCSNDWRGEVGVRANELLTGC